MGHVMRENKLPSMKTMWKASEEYDIRNVASILSACIKIMIEEGNDKTLPVEEGRADGTVSDKEERRSFSS